MPGTGIGIVFRFVESVIGSQHQVFLCFEQCDAVDPATFVGNVVLEPPPQPARKIHLTVQRLAAWVVAGMGIIANTVEHGLIGGHAIGMCGQILGVQVNDIAEHRIATLFTMKDKHLAHAARFAVGKEQVFGVVAIIHPDAGCGLNDPVYGFEHDQPGNTFQIDPMHLGGQVLCQMKLVRCKDDDGFETQPQMMVQRAGQLDVVLGKNQCYGAFGQCGLSRFQEMVEGIVRHRVFFGPALLESPAKFG